MSHRWRQLAVFVLLVLGLSFGGIGESPVSAAGLPSASDGVLRIGGSPVIAAGGKHSCGIRSNGTASCWGDDTDGQTDVPQGVTFTAIAAGASHSCGIKTDGTATCWGNAADGRTNVPSDQQFTAITAGDKFSCGIKTDSTAVCWGDNLYGQTAVPSGEQFTAISAGGLHVCGIRTDGTATCWGWFDNERLDAPSGEHFTAIAAGDAHTCGIRTNGTATCWGVNANERQAVPSGEYFTAIAAGDQHGCGTKTDGSTVCWGDDSYGQTSPPGERLTAITADGNHTCGIKTDGTATCWGNSAYGQAVVPTGQFGYGQIDAGEFHTCGLRTNGTAGCWGTNEAGKASPPPGEQFTTVSAGDSHSCGIRPNRTATCWGKNDTRQGNVPPGVTFTAITTGLTHSCGIKTDGTAACWGMGAEPPNVVPPGVTFTTVSAGSYFSCGIKTDGTATCWGANQYGQRDAPQDEQFTAIAAGPSHVCAIRTDGSVTCWGNRGSGQTNVPQDERFSAITVGQEYSCGIKIDGTVSCWGYEFHVPGHIPQDEHFVALSSGNSHICGIKTDGTTRCWGSNLYGQQGGAPKFSTAPPKPQVGQAPYTHTYRATPTAPSNPVGPPTTYRVTDGELPPGLTLNATTGLLSGTPTQAGTFTGTVTASNGFFVPDATQTFSLTVDLAPPAAPALTASDPVSPAREQTPRLTGTAEAGSTVRIYTTSTCTGTPLVTGAAGDFATPGLSVAVTADRTTTLYATATDEAGNASDCSSGLLYVNDRTAPTAPTLTSDPLSPSRDLTPMLTGSAEAGSTVRIYTTSSCTGTPTANGAASALAAPGLPVTVQVDTTTTFYATSTDQAGNVSACSTGVAYRNDRTAPAAPVLGRIDPASPGTALTIRIDGQAEATSQVRIYTTDTCSGTPVATGSAAQLAGPGLNVTVAADATTTLYAAATDAAGNVSACSAGLPYRNDRTAPDAPTLTGTSPASPAQSLTPRILGAAERDSTVRVYDDSACTGTPLVTGSAGELASPGLPVTVGSEKTTRLYATATDQVGNVSVCSATLAYRNDRTAPDAPVLLRTDPAPPAQSLTPRVVGSAEPGATIRIYGNANCSGAPLTTGAADVFSDSGLVVTVAADRTTTLSATATDEAGNLSPCTTTGLTYRNDRTPPTAPTLWLSRTSPGSALEIRILGEAEGESTVRVYASESCAGRPLATLTASKLAELGVAETVAANSSTRYSATATDQVGNVSSCSQPVTYTHRPDPVLDPPPGPPSPPAPDPPSVPVPKPQPQPEPTPATCLTGKLTLTTLSLTASGRRERLLVAGLADPAFAGQKLTVTVQDRPGAKARPAGTTSVGTGGSYQLTIAATSGRKAAKSRYLVQLVNGVRTAARKPDRGVVLRSQKTEQNGQVRITATLPASKPRTAVRIQREIACQAGRTTVATVKTNGKRQITAILPAVGGQTAIYHLSAGSGRATVTVPAR